MRNLSYYRAGSADGRLIRDGEFWKTINGNFLDTCVSEWCKLFGDRRGKHHWRQVLPDPNQFSTELLVQLDLSEEAFADYIRQMRLYRDKFVAHLDDELEMNIPNLDIALSSIIIFYDRLRMLPQALEYFPEFPATAAEYLKQSRNEATEVYK